MRCFPCQCVLIKSLQEFAFCGLAEAFYCRVLWCVEDKTIHSCKKQKTFALFALFPPPIDHADGTAGAGRIGHAEHGTCRSWCHVNNIFAVRMLACRAQLALCQHGIMSCCADKNSMDAIAACNCDTFMDDESFCHSRNVFRAGGKGLCVSRHDGL